MCPTDNSFEEVLERFEKNGWNLQKIQGRFRVFTKDGEPPWLIPVENNKVKSEHVEKIKQFFKEEHEEQNPCGIPD